jgi:hypothetical protein
MQHFLKSAPRSARTRIIATEFLDQIFAAAAHNAITALHMRFGREALPALTTDLESNSLRGVLS